MRFGSRKQDFHNRIFSYQLYYNSVYYAILYQCFRELVIVHFPEIPGACSHIPIGEQNFFLLFIPQRAIIKIHVRFFAFVIKVPVRSAICLIRLLSYTRLCEKRAGFYFEYKFNLFECRTAAYADNVNFSRFVAIVAEKLKTFTSQILPSPPP